MDEWMAWWMDGLAYLNPYPNPGSLVIWLAGWLDGWMDGWMDGWLVRWMDFEYGRFDG